MELLVKLCAVVKTKPNLERAMGRRTMSLLKQLSSFCLHCLTIYDVNSLGFLATVSSYPEAWHFNLISVLDYLCPIVLLSSLVPADIHLCCSSMPSSVLTRSHPNACAEYSCVWWGCHRRLASHLPVLYLSRWLHHQDISRLTSLCVRKHACWLLAVPWFEWTLSIIPTWLGVPLISMILPLQTVSPRKASGPRGYMPADLRFILMCVSLCLCEWKPHVCTWRPKEGVGSPGAGVIGSCELSGRRAVTHPTSSGRAASNLRRRGGLFFYISLAKRKRNNVYLLSVRQMGDKCYFIVISADCQRLTIWVCLLVS